MKVKNERHQITEEFKNWVEDIIGSTGGVVKTFYDDGYVSYIVVHVQISEQEIYLAFSHETPYLAFTYHTLVESGTLEDYRDDFK